MENRKTFIKKSLIIVLCIVNLVLLLSHIHTFCVLNNGHYRICHPDDNFYLQTNDDTYIDWYRTNGLDEFIEYNLDEDDIISLLYDYEEKGEYAYYEGGILFPFFSRAEVYAISLFGNDAFYNFDVDKIYVKKDFKIPLFTSETVEYIVPDEKKPEEKNTYKEGVEYILSTYVPDEDKFDDSRIGIKFKDSDTVCSMTKAEALFLLKYSTNSLERTKKPILKTLWRQKAL